jgi:hypothetical protein
VRAQQGFTYGASAEVTSPVPLEYLNHSHFLGQIWRFSESQHLEDEPDKLGTGSRALTGRIRPISTRILHFFHLPVLQGLPATPRLTLSDPSYSRPWPYQCRLRPLPPINREACIPKPLPLKLSRLQTAVGMRVTSANALSPLVDTLHATPGSILENATTNAPSLGARRDALARTTSSSSEYSRLLRAQSKAEVREAPSGLTGVCIFSRVCPFVGEW